jgi:hypothetical protein
MKQTEGNLLDDERFRAAIIPNNSTHPYETD